jgi:hypothetical protein
MSRESPVAVLSRLSQARQGVFRGRVAVRAGVSRTQLVTLTRNGVIERLLPDTYRMASVPRSEEQLLHAALLWAGDRAAVAGRSAARLYELEGVSGNRTEIVVPHGARARTSAVTVLHADRAAVMVRRVRGFPTTGPEHTLLRLAFQLPSTQFEIACEDARRRRLTSVPALRAYLDRFGQRGRPGVARLRAALDGLDPVHPARSTLEVLTRRLLVMHGLTSFTREFALSWEGRTYFFDFGFEPQHVILETNGRRWHDDDRDYEFDQEKWSVPGRHGYRLVFATWDKVTRHPDDLVRELEATLSTAR